MTETASTLMAAAGEVAQIAGMIALGHYSDRPATEIKADGSPVTIADRAAERAARDWIAARFPKDGIVGEEFGANATDARRRWFIDPIDGTKSYVRGVPLWGTLIAVCEAETVIASAIFCPAVSEMMIAGLGEGCWLNAARVSVSTVSDVAQATVLASGLQFARPERGEAWQRLVSSVGVARTWGDCYGYLLVASGRAEVMADATVADWDTAAVQRCIVEAGGVFTDWDGKDTAFGGSAIATNAALAGQVRGILR
jgi:histidinol-phosphatase